MPKAFGFPRALRIRNKAEIDTVFRQGRYHRMGWLQAKTQPNGRTASRFMISISLRAGSAPGRNRIKRVLREAVRLHRQAFEMPHDVCLFVTNRPPRAICLQDAESGVQQLLGRLAQPSAGRGSDG